MRCIEANTQISVDVGHSPVDTASSASRSYLFVCTKSSGALAIIGYK